LEDAGAIGDVNQGSGNARKYGELRVADVGIREATIRSGIGMALRGLPIAEIQYLDYLLYAIQIMSDDLATNTER
jgi:pyruvate/2-oxoglutarate/acetoin dehydrogenase E1 component